jgi:hypothetical protein
MTSNASTSAKPEVTARMQMGDATGFVALPLGAV